MLLGNGIPGNSCDGVNAKVFANSSVLDSVVCPERIQHSLIFCKPDVQIANQSQVTLYCICEKTLSHRVTQSLLVCC